MPVQAPVIRETENQAWGLGGLGLGALRAGRFPQPQIVAHTNGSRSKQAQLAIRLVQQGIIFRNAQKNFVGLSESIVSFVCALPCLGHSIKLN